MAQGRGCAGCLSEPFPEKTAHESGWPHATWMFKEGETGGYVGKMLSRKEVGQGSQAQVEEGGRREGRDEETAAGWLQCLSGEGPCLGLAPGKPGSPRGLPQASSPGLSYLGLTAVCEIRVVSPSYRANS